MNDFRYGAYSGPVQGDGVQHNYFGGSSYGPAPTALAALPPTPPEFGGRDADLDVLLGLLDPHQSEGSAKAAVISAVAGLPGVGKTTLAIAAAHEALDRGWFTGAQFLNLRGYDEAPVAPDQALDALLRSLGVAAEHIPASLDARAGLYRSELVARAGRGERLLIVADNASAAEQVRPLLPAATEHRVLVTSRHTLPGLGRLIDLGTLRPQDAVRMLEQALHVADPGDARVKEDDEAAHVLARACGYLPLALQITAAQLAADPGQPLAERAAQLTEAGSALSDLDDGERAVRAAFDQSLQRLLPQEADLFRLLGLNPGADLSTQAVAVLADRKPAETLKLLTELARAHLVERGQVRGRWQMHDLLRQYAAGEAAARMAGARPVRRRYEQATVRLIAHYEKNTAAADGCLQDPQGIPVRGVFKGRAEALEWMDAERANLIATVHTGGHAGAHLATHLSTYFFLRRRYDDSITVSRLARDVFQALGDRHGEASASNNLGSALRSLTRYEESISAYQHAIDLFQGLGDRFNEAMVCFNFGLALRELRRHEESIACHEKAREIFAELGDRGNEGQAWNHLGGVLNTVERHEEALAAHRTAIDMFRELGDRHKEAMALSNLGRTLSATGRHEESIEAHLAAVRMHREIGGPDGGAEAWGYLGRAFEGQHRHAEAVEAYRTAIRLLQECGDRHSEGEAWSSLGVALHDARHTEEALAAHRTAITMLHELASPNEAMAWGNLGVVLGDAGRHEEAVEACRTAVAMFRAQGGREDVAGNESNLGRVLWAMGQYEEAIELLRTAVDTLGDLESRKEAVAWHNLAEALTAAGRFDEAVAAHQHAIGLFEGYGDAFRAGQAYAGLAETRQAAGLPGEGVRTAWEKAAGAYGRAGAEEEASTARARAAENC